MRRRDFIRSGGGAFVAANLAPFIFTRHSPLFTKSSSHVVSVFDGKASFLNLAPGDHPSRDGVMLNKVLDYSVNRVRVSNMVDEAVKKLTGKQTVGKAWESLFPAGHPTQKTTIAIKLNFSYGEGGEVNDWINTLCPYAPKVAMTDAIVSGLTQMLDGNFPIENIVLFDATNLSDTKLGFMLRQGYRPVQQNREGFYKENESGAHRMHWVKARNAGESPDTAPGFIAAPDYPMDYQAPQKIYSAVYENDFMINVANAKTHRASGVTGVMKNTFGCTNNPVGTHGQSEWRDALSSPFAGTRKTIPVFYKSIEKHTPTILNVVDAIGGMHHGGPLSGMIFGENAIAVSKDPVAIDSYMLALINKHRKAGNLSVLNTTDEGRPGDGYPSSHASFLRYSEELHNLGSQSLEGLEVIDRTASPEEYDIPILDKSQARVSDTRLDQKGVHLDLSFDHSDRQHVIQSRVEDIKGNPVKEYRTNSVRSSRYTIGWDFQTNQKKQAQDKWYVWHVSVDGTRYSRIIHHEV
ncbi:MAG: DUF362 domain-containing protein [Cyclobacteriaceae bacterium]|nr:DUF362 domain-containing protein [Cyclobacteriaceae bacterium]